MSPEFTDEINDRLALKLFVVKKDPTYEYDVKNQV